MIHGTTNIKFIASISLVSNCFKCHYWVMDFVYYIGIVIVGVGL